MPPNSINQIKDFLTFATSRDERGDFDIDRFVERFPQAPDDQNVVLGMLAVETSRAVRHNSRNLRRIRMIAIAALCLAVYATANLEGFDLATAIVAALATGGVSLILRLF